MRHFFKWGGRLFQVDLTGAAPPAATIAVADETREAAMSVTPPLGRGHLPAASGSMPYFVTAAPKGVWVTLAGQTFFFERAKGKEREADAVGASFEAPMPGKVLDVFVQPDQAVKAGEVMVIMEAMKMEHRIEAPVAGTVLDVFCKPGDVVEQGFRLLAFEPAP